MYKAVVYLSQQKRELGPLEFDNLIKMAVEKNSQLLITGFLTKFDGQYFQYLEGSGARLDILMKSIRQDERHQVLSEFAYETDQRYVYDWSMQVISPVISESVHFGNLAENIFKLPEYSHNQEEKAMLFIRLIKRWVRSFKEERKIKV